MRSDKVVLHDLVRLKEELEGKIRILEERVGELEQGRISQSKKIEMYRMRRA